MGIEHSQRYDSQLLRYCCCSLPSLYRCYVHVVTGGRYHHYYIHSTDRLPTTDYPSRSLIYGLRCYVRY